MMPPANEWTPSRIERLTQLWAANATASIIGAELGISRSAVIGKVHRLKLPAREKRMPDAQSEEIRKERNRERIERQRRARVEARGAEYRPRLAPAPVTEPEADPTPRIPFLDLRRFQDSEPNQCRYIADEPPGPLYLACSAETRAGESYCPRCSKIVRANHANTSAERAEHIRMGSRQFRESVRKRFASA